MWTGDCDQCLSFVDDNASSSSSGCSEVTVFAERFQDYKVYVHGVGGADGQARLTIDLETTPAPTPSPTMRPTTAFPTPASTSWYLGDGPEDCDAVCARNGLQDSCNVERLNAINTGPRVHFVAFVLGLNCMDNLIVASFTSDPQFDNDKCYAQGAGASTCSAEGTNPVGEPGRFCCCSANAADCPLA